MVIAVIVAGGNSSRMGKNKLKINIGKKRVLEKTLLAFDTCDEVDKLILATDDEELINMARLCVTGELVITKSGSERQYTVEKALEQVGDDDVVLIHDGARPFITHDVIKRCIESVLTYGSGVAAVPVFDTLKKADEGMSVIKTIDRSGVYAMQTPQGFLGKIIKRAHKQHIFGTDDAYLVEQMGKEVRLVMGDKDNIKLTTPSDIPKQGYRIGQGYDVHKLVENRKLIIGGVDIPYEKGLLGHSDADVATHALMDALLGAAGGYDIGRMFPDNDDSFKGASSLKLLERVGAFLGELGYELVNCDVTICAQKPKLLPYIDEMKINISKVLKTSSENVNIKATTTEHLGFEGRGEGISAMAVAMLRGI